MQAFLITAYKNQDQLVRLIQSINENALVYVHLDKKSKALSLQKLNALQLKNTQFVSEYKISWGGIDHLLAILLLINLALADERVTYLHTISGQDIRVCPLKELEQRFNTSNEIYMTCTNSKNFPHQIKERYQHHIITSHYFPEKTLVRILNYCYISLQKCFHYEWHTIKPFDDIYKGMIWCSMPRDAAQYAIDFSTKNPVFLRYLKHVSIPEEFFFQSIFMTSEYKKNVTPRNLRYTDWTKRNGSMPAILDETDFDKIVKGDYIFARKIDPFISGKLVLMINQYLRGE